MRHCNVNVTELGIYKWARAHVRWLINLIDHDVDPT